MRSLVNSIAVVTISTNASPRRIVWLVSAIMASVLPDMACSSQSALAAPLQRAVSWSVLHGSATANHCQSRPKAAPYFEEKVNSRHCDSERHCMYSTARQVLQRTGSTKPMLPIVCQTMLRRIADDVSVMMESLLSAIELEMRFCVKQRCSFYMSREQRYSKRRSVLPN